ncbi:hypothetical protein EV44_g3568 [Erysiphe necator]|uniref:Uncharacterized protein n=1 Tax=Uncinula necator TaxID=52586 RepID=A0A0B1PE21_UNCNE|nr:hypothetical protein EV44_g3568 [Erysiphe necator]
MNGEEHDNVGLIFDFWHETLCHPAESSFEKTKPLTINSNILKVPKDFNFQAYSSSKSTHIKPKSVGIIKSEKRTDFILISVDPFQCFNTVMLGITYHSNTFNPSEDYVMYTH